MNRNKPMPRPKKGLAGKTGLSRTTGLQRTAGLTRTVQPPKPPRLTGFPARVKLQVRKRAGNGEIEAALCEACGQWLGRYGGQVQHIVARGMGGTSDPVLSTSANGALLCGLTPQDPDGCHYLAEARHREIRDRGFWLPQGSDPRDVPMTLHTGTVAWRAEDGSYLFQAPGRAAA